MADSEILIAIKSLQSHLESQLLAINSTIQECMLSVDERFTKLHFLSQQPPFTPFTPESSHKFHPHEHHEYQPDIANPFNSMKMAAPKFDGSDPAGWIFRIEEFFNFHNTPEETRLKIVSFHMEGRAASWFQWMKVNHLLSTWPMFLHSLKHRFGSSLYEDPQGTLSKLTQTSSVAEFQSSFEDLMNKVEGISEPLLISFFITGLKSDIRRELSFSKPSSLMEAFALARAYEARIEEPKFETKLSLHWPIEAISLNTVPPSVPITATPSSAIRSNPALPPLLPSPSLPIQKFIPQELKEKRDKGFCCNCDQKWFPAHKCRSQFLFLLGIDDDEPPDDRFQPDLSLDAAVLGDISSLHIFSGLGKLRSLHLKGKISNHQLRVLVDSGSTHNFVQPSIVQMVQLETKFVPPFCVHVGNGDYLTCQHRCPAVKINLQDKEFVVDLNVLAIEGPSVVMGIQWLQTLGPVIHDYHTMEFGKGNLMVKLTGDVVDEIFELIFWPSFNEADSLSLLQSEANAFTPKSNIPKEIQLLLVTYQYLVDSPTGLPPLRFVDHRIHLHPTAAQGNVRPYQYSQFQKQEMVKMVLEVLLQGTIRPKHSLLYSLVLLVREKDGTFCFGVDHQDLNAVTIRDNFLILKIDELLDDVGPAKIFTPLDLHSSYHQLHSRDIHQTAFRIADGHEFLVMPYGLCNAPSTFQAAMDDKICVLPPESQYSHLISQPLMIGAKRNLLAAVGGLRRQILVQLLGRPPEYSTWEDLEEFHRSFSDFNLEDKVNFKGGGSVTPLGTILAAGLGHKFIRRPKKWKMAAHGGKKKKTQFIGPCAPRNYPVG